MSDTTNINATYDLLVIGAGPAGLSCGVYAARAGLSVALLEQLSPGGQLALTTKVENYPGFPSGIEGFDLALHMKEQAEAFGAKIINDEVQSVNLQGAVKTLTGAEGAYSARAVVVASGCHPRLLGVPGEQELTGRGVSYCATCDGNFYRGGKVVVVGGGDTAVTDALYLARMCRNVVLIHRQSSLRASAVLVARLQEMPNIEIIWDTVVEGISDAPGASATPADNAPGRRALSLRLSHTHTDKRSSLICDGVFVAVGTQPNTAFLAGQLALTPAGYIATNEHLETSVPGVFAAGDVREKTLRQVVTAASDGAVCAQSAADYLSF